MTPDERAAKEALWRLGKPLCVVCLEPLTGRRSRTQRCGATKPIEQNGLRWGGKPVCANQGWACARCLDDDDDLVLCFEHRPDLHNR